MTGERMEEMKKQILVSRLNKLPIISKNFVMVNDYFIKEVTNHNWKNINLTVQKRIENKCSYAYYTMVLALIETIDCCFFNMHMETLREK